MADVATLIQSLRCAEESGRQAAAEQLAKLGADAQPAAVALVESCATEDDETREWVAAALEDLGPPPANDVARLAVLVANRSLDVAYWAATLLGRLRHEAEPAGPALATALEEHPEMAVRQRAAWALGRIGQPAADARSALDKAASSTDPRLASLARDALDKLKQ